MPSQRYNAHRLFPNKRIMVLVPIGMTWLRAPAPSVPALAFSPYESYLLSGQGTRVGLIARAELGREEEVKQTLLALKNPTETESMARAGISHVVSFSREFK